MADLTPTDIVNKDFPQSLRGYTVREVDDYLQQVSDSLFRALEENQRLRGQVEEMRGRLQHYQQHEEFIQKALVLAEKTAEDTRRAARQDADLIQREAQEQIRKERTELEELNQLRLRIIAEMRAVLYAQLSLLESQEQRLVSTSPAARPEEKDS